MGSERLIEHFSNPRNVGIIEDPDGHSRVSSPVCSDIVEAFVRVREGVIRDIKCRIFGCGVAIASASIISEIVMGQPVAFAERMTDEQVAEALGGLPESKKHCSRLAATALHAALEDYRDRQTRVAPR